MPEDKNQSSYLKYMANPRSFTIKKWFADLLKEKYIPHDAIIERVGNALITDKDLKDFGDLITSVYEAAYMKAISDYKSELEKMGIKIKIVADKNVQEKSGETSLG